jgi:cobalt/nickel transport protein
MIRRATAAVILVVLVFTIAMLLGQSTGLTGSDDKAVSVIQEINPGFQPWVTSLLDLSEETEGLLLACQAAIGAGFIGYFFVKRGRSGTKSKERDY